VRHQTDIDSMSVLCAPFKKGRGTMKCKKCEGTMVLQSFFDHFLNFDGWKCLNCGKIILRKEKNIEFDSFSVFYQQNKSRNRG
jgi:hypothetical protein